MLKSLKIRSIALVAEADLTFDGGLSVLTGETGAGKSIVVGALALALGERADREMIRHGADRALVEATFQVSHLGLRYKREFEDYIRDGVITVAREISRDGASRVRINDAASTLARLKELIAPLVEILGQHANQVLMDEENHLLFLDHFAQLDPLRQSVAQLFSDWEQASRTLVRVTAQRDHLTAERELFSFQKVEIERAHVRIGEEQQLEEERRILSASRSLMTSADLIQKILDNEESSVGDLLRRAGREIDTMAEIDTSLLPAKAQLHDLNFQVEDLRRTLEQYGSSIPDNPERLEQINLRLDELYKLRKKYGGSEEAILSTLDQVNSRLAAVPDTDDMIAALTKEIADLFAEYTLKARELTDLRTRAADYLRKLVLKELAELAIEKANFSCEFVYEDLAGGVAVGDRTVKPHPHGLESIRFLFSANQGEPLKSLIKTASGGEISRVLLALKIAEKKNSKLVRSLMVFDEVDTGIGGKTATAVGQKLSSLADGCQVLVITHLHQIARLADHHYVAEKTQRSGSRATIAFRELAPPDVATELSRMVSIPD